VTPEARSDAVKRVARELGFDSVGITTLDPPPHAKAFNRWLDEGMAGTMTYMHRQAARRLEPATIVPGATRAVVVTRGYQASEPPVPAAGGHVARYARGPDYHTALREPLNRLVEEIRALGDAGTIARAFVDAGPVPERELAQRAGLGWIGKNTMLIDPARGSYFFLASVLTNAALAIDAPFEADRCGTCRRCLDACPTGAFPAPRVLDSRRCISYLTIEFRGDIPEELARLMGSWAFGCDMCQEVCPWNVKFSEEADRAALPGDPALAWLDLEVLAEIRDGDFERRFGHTALERPGAAGMRRNARIARSNRGRGGE
jgi:epoxyqueuosine reductase